MLFNKYKKIDNNKWGEAYKSSPNVYGKTDVELLKESYYSFTDDIQNQYKIKFNELLNGAKNNKNQI